MELAKGRTEECKCEDGSQVVDAQGNRIAPQRAGFEMCLQGKNQGELEVQQSLTHALTEVEPLNEMNLELLYNMTDW